jgi:Fungal protein kinase
MNEREVGFDPIIIEDGGRYTDIQRNDQLKRLFLKELIKRQRSVAGRATTCWKGSGAKSEGPLAIKDS